MSKVVMMITPTQGIEPPESWRLELNGYYMGRDSTREGRLVLLQSVVLWLRESRQIPLTEASRIVEERLNEDICGDLYSVQPGAFAKRWDANEDFTLGAWQFSVARRLSASESLKSLRSWLSAGCENLNGTCSQIAILLTNAYELWGYGHLRQSAVPVSDTDVKTWAGLLAFRKNNPNHKWTSEMKITVSTEKGRRKGKPGATGVAKAMAAELGVSEKRLNDLVRSAPSGGQNRAANGI